MTVTPQTNATLEEIARALVGRDRFCICGHVNPDGDCIGSTLGLARALRAIGKDVVTLVADDGVLDPTFMFMPGADGLVFAGDYDGPCDVFVVVDAPNRERIGEAAYGVRERAGFTVTLDHHAVPERMSDLSYTDPDSASSTMIVWKLAKHLGIGDDEVAWRDIATCTYSGLVTDTGRFMFQNSDADAFACASDMVQHGIDPAEISRELFQERSIASVEMDGVAVRHMEFVADGRAVLSWISVADIEAAGAEKADTEHAINVIRSIRGIDVACILKEREDCVRGSLRAKGGLDVAMLARELNGGGHKAAAGFTLYMPLDEGRAFMAQKIADFLA